MAVDGEVLVGEGTSITVVEYDADLRSLFSFTFLNASPLSARAGLTSVPCTSSSNSSQSAKSNKVGTGCFRGWVCLLKLLRKSCGNLERSLATCEPQWSSMAPSSSI